MFSTFFDNLYMLVWGQNQKSQQYKSKHIINKKLLQVIYMFNNYILTIKKRPYAFAKIKGSNDYTSINGIAYFYKTESGVLLSIQLKGLPVSDDICKKPIFAIHIHSGGSCTGNKTDSFADAMTHYKPDDCAHPYHAGDLPPVFGVNGFGFSAFLTNRFTAEEVIGKTLIIHSATDDFTTQPSGNSGMKIACGVISSIY